MHKHTARPPACSGVVGIADGAEALNNREASRRSVRDQVTTVYLRRRSDLDDRLGRCTLG